jgi:1-acyl-sn-glycerol-3-phosphate acyltransferase
MKPQVYVDPRPEEFFTKYHVRTRTRRPDWVYRAARIVLSIPMLGIYRFRAIDVDNVPYEGPVILAPNHFSFFDHFFVAVLLRREVQFMAKSQLFKPPLDFILSHGGTFPVRRGQKDDETFITAHSILDRGGTVLMYAEGGRSRSKHLGEPKPGLGRLVLESGVPVAPIAIHGSQNVREANRGRISPKVTVHYGKPIAYERVEHPTRDQAQAVANEVFARVEEMYEALNAQGRRGVLARLRQERRHGAPVTS